MKKRVSIWRESLIWRVLSNAGWASAATPITIGLGVVQTGMMARMLGPEGFGAIALFGAVSAVFGSLFKLNSAEAVLVYATKALTRRDYEKASSVVRYCYLIDLLTSVVAFMVVAASALLLPGLLNLSADQKWLQVVFGLTLVFKSTYWVSHAILRLTDRFSWTFYHSVAHSMVKTVLVAVLLISEAGLVEIVLLLVGLSLFDGLSLYLLAHLASRNEMLFSVESSSSWWRVPREIRRFQVLGYGRSITKSLYSHLDMLVVGYLDSPGSVGLFRSARQVTNLLNVPTRALVSSLAPEYSQLWFDGRIERLRRLVGRVLCISFVAFGVLALALVLFADQAISVVFGEAFLSARQPILILLLGSLLGMVMMPLNTLQTATGRAGPSTAAGVATVLVQTVLMLALVPRLGISGAAWARVGGLVASAAIMLPTGISRFRESPTADDRSKCG